MGSGIVSSTYIFQSVVTRFDLRTRLAPGASQTWYATRYLKLMAPGDLVLFWMGGPTELRGLYGWGRLLGAPYSRPEWNAHGVDVQVETAFGQHIPAERVRQAVPDLPIFRMPQATNFLLSPDEASRLWALVAASRERTPSFVHLAA